MKTILAFLAGCVVGWWVKRVKPCQEQEEVNTVRLNDEGGFLMTDEEAKQIEDWIVDGCPPVRLKWAVKLHPSLADTQPIKLRTWFAPGQRISS